MNFADKLAQLMDEHGESNYRLAKELCVSQTTIANWLSGTIPHWNARRALAKHYGLDEKAFDKISKEAKSNE